MKLAKLKTQLLREIWNAYPIPADDDDDDDETIAIGERPLPTLTDLCAKFRRVSEGRVEDAVNGLLSYQYVKRVYLYHSSEYADQRSGGITIRHLPMTAERKGKDCFQITQTGKELIENSFTQRIKAFLSSEFPLWVWRCLTST